MPDIEKVMIGLRACTEWGMTEDECMANGCPYLLESTTDDETATFRCLRMLHEDAMNLIAPFPRLLTLDELRSLPLGAVVWYEKRAKDQTYIMPMVVTADGHIGNWALGVCMDVIGQDDRCWSARPTDEQRDATPWRA